MHRLEVLLQVGCRRVQLSDPFICVLLGKFGEQARPHRQNVCDPIPAQNVLIFSSDVITQEQSIDYLVQRLNFILHFIYHL